MDGETVSYLIMFCVAFALAGLLLYRRYLSKERSHRSRTRRESAAFKDLLAKERTAKEE